MLNKRSAFGDPEHGRREPCLIEPYLVPGSRTGAKLNGSELDIENLTLKASIRARELRRYRIARQESKGACAVTP